MEYTFRVLKFSAHPGDYDRVAPLQIVESRFSQSADSPEEALETFMSPGDGEWFRIQGKYGDPGGIDNLIEVLDMKEKQVVLRTLVSVREITPKKNEDSPEVDSSSV